MRIGELSRRSGVSPRSLRYYESHGLLTASRGDNGYREYDEDAVPRAQHLRLLFALGIDRDLARSVLACSGDVPQSVHRATRDQLSQVRDRTIAQIDELTGVRAALDEVLARMGPMPAES